MPKNPPLPAFVCVHCLTALDYADPLLPPPSGESPEFAAAARKAFLKPLIRGRMHLLSLSQRFSTQMQYHQNRKAFEEFCGLIDIALFPAAPATIMDFAVYSILVRKLDATTAPPRRTVSAL